MTYKEELFNALEQFLLDNNIYSQFVTYILERFNRSLLEFYNDRFEEECGDLSLLLYYYFPGPCYPKWYHIAIEIQSKYERGV